MIFNTRSVCDRILDLISHPYGRDTGQDGPSRHLVPGAGQHLQQRHHQHSQGRGSHCHRSLDVGLHSFCVRGSSRVSFFFGWAGWSLSNRQKSMKPRNWKSLYRYATLLFKKQRYVSGQHKINLKIICKENYKYEVQEKSPANQAVTVQQLNEEYWRWGDFSWCAAGSLQFYNWLAALYVSLSFLFNSPWWSENICSKITEASSLVTSQFGLKTWPII